MKANLSCCFGTNTLQLQSYSLAVNSVPFYLRKTSHALLSCDKIWTSQNHRGWHCTLLYWKELEKRTMWYKKQRSGKGQQNSLPWRCFETYVFASEEVERKLKPWETVGHSLASYYLSSRHPVSQVGRRPLNTQHNTILLEKGNPCKKGNHLKKILSWSIIKLCDCVNTDNSVCHKGFASCWGNCQWLRSAYTAATGKRKTYLNVCNGK